MSNKLFKFAKLYTELVEAFDFKNIVPVKLYKISSILYVSSDKSIKANFKEYDLEEIELINLPTQLKNVKSVFNVGFSIDDLDSQSYKTDYKEYVAILAGVKDAIMDFIKNKNPDVLIFVSMDRGGDMANDNTKTKLYKYALMKNLPTGYKLETDLKLFADYDLEGMILYKSNLWEVSFQKRFTR
jgi:hypothetical protein